MHCQPHFLAETNEYALDTCCVKDSGCMGNFVRNRVIFHMLSTLIHTLKNLSILNALPLFSACIEFGQNVVETFSCELYVYFL